MLCISHLASTLSKVYLNLESSSALNKRLTVAESMNTFIRDHPLRIPLHSDTTKCVVCGSTNPSIHIPATLIAELYYERDLFIRCTHKRCNNNQCQQRALSTITTSHHRTNLPYTHLSQNYNIYRYFYQQLHQQHTELVNEQTDHTCYITFANSSEERIKAFCRISKQNIIELSTTYNIPREDLFIFFTLCFRGSSYRYLEHIVTPARSSISRIFRDVLPTLHAQFVPTELNRAWTREKVKQNTPQFVSELFQLHDDQRLFITDGFMIYTGKSQDFNIQHREHNAYKKRNCWIFMPIICANGRYIINLGPYCSDKKNTDQTIYETATDIEYLTELRNYYDGIHDMNEDRIVFDERTTDKLLWFNKQLFLALDAMIADRGYAECDDERVQCPPQLNPPKKPGRKKKGAPKPPPPRKQLPPDEANQFRQVTLIRHTVERDYGRLKQWEILVGLCPYQYRDCIEEIVDVLMAIENKFFCVMTKDSIKNTRYMQRVLDHLLGNESIKVMPWVKEDGWEREGNVPSDCVHVISSLDFLPDYDDKDIRELGMGDCNWRLAKRYIRHFVDFLEIYLHPSHPNTVLFQRVASRYSG